MQFNDVIDSFLVESLEGLDVMERGLLQMQPGPVDPETINDVFRAAHSIKGGGGIFGFGEIAAFMHGVETLLDELRNGSREASAELLELLLATVDCARSMFEAARKNEPQRSARVKELTRALNKLIETDGTGSDEQAPEQQAGHAHWRIRFSPDPGMLAKANDPLRMFRELAAMGSLQTRADLEGLPDFDALDPTRCYLRWELDLEADTGAEALNEVFAWVMDECELDVQPVSPAAPGGTAKAEPRKTARTAPRPQRETHEEKTAAPARAAGGAGANAAASESIRVSIDKLDNLINLVGELVITQSMLSRFDKGLMTEEDIHELQNGLIQLTRNTRDLQESVLQIRMLPIHFCFSRFPRLVHDISHKLNKKAHLKLEGEDTELDKTVLERINDPLVHLVRNALDHGLETPEARLAADKPETGTVLMRAYHESGNIVIEVADDGRGLDSTKIRARAVERGLIAEDEQLSEYQINNLIFQPGFSTVDAVSDLSGRGVGMDVVKRNINGLGGDVWLESRPGRGTTVTVRLPLTLAILDGQLLRVGEEIYIMPLNAIVKTVQIRPDKVNVLPGNLRLYRLREDHVPIVRLDEAFGVQAQAEKLEDGLLVIVDSERQYYGIWVDELLDQQQVVIKSLESNFKHVRGISGATILGDGTVALILDVTGIVTDSGAKHAPTNLAVA